MQCIIYTENIQNAGASESGWVLVMGGYHILYLIDLIIGLILSILLNLVLIPDMGITGAGIATAVWWAVVTILIQFHVWRIFKLHPFDKFYFRKVMTFIISLLIPFSLPHSASFLFRTLMFVVSFIIIFLTFAKSSEDMEIIKVILRKVTGKGISI